MGQYHIVINLDRGEYLFPHHLGDGLKLLEFGDGGKTMTALAVPLAMDNGRGLGDLHAVTPELRLRSGRRASMAPCGRARSMRIL